MADENNERRVGLLIDQAGDDGVDDEPDAVASEVLGTPRRDQIDPGAWTGQEGTDREEVIAAEEAAMHLTEDPPMGDGDGYVED